MRQDAKQTQARDVEQAHDVEHARDAPGAVDCERPGAERER